MEARRRGLAETVTFVGSVPHRELPDWYRAADLTVLPSRSEGVPNAWRESLACGNSVRGEPGRRDSGNRS
jgi:teichuronic acid biosynthesis glycosyltransferase TuaC